MKKLFWYIFIIGFSIFCLGCNKRLSHRSDVTLEPVQTAYYNEAPIPLVTFKDASNAPVKLSDYLGYPIVLHFISIKDSALEENIEILNEISLEKPENTVILLVVDSDAETALSNANLKEINTNTIRLVYDPGSESAAELKVSSTPYTFFIDKDGFITAESVSSASAEAMQFGISLIKGK